MNKQTSITSVVDLMSPMEFASLGFIVLKEFFIPNLASPGVVIIFLAVSIDDLNDMESPQHESNNDILDDDYEAEERLSVQ